MMMQLVNQPELENMLVEASDALAHLDASRLEEMALSCAALVRDMDEMRCDATNQWESGSSEATKDMAIFARVLEATRANLKVLRRLREMREGALERSPAWAGGRVSGEREHGEH